MLRDLVDAVQRRHPTVEQLEDFVPLDGRLDVLVRWNGELLRTLPGSLERPVALVEEHALLASVIDPALMPQLGFGLADVGEVILRRLDHVARLLGPAWPSTARAEIGDAPSVTAAEVAAAGQLPSLEQIVEECSEPVRARAAVRRYTVRPAELHFDPSDPVASFGTAIAVRLGSRSVPVPAGALIEALPAIGADLAALAVRVDATLDRAFAGVVANRVGRLFQGLGQTITGPVAVGRAGGRIHSLVVFDPRQILALDVAAGLSAETIQRRLHRGGRTLSLVQPGAEIRGPAATWTLSEDAHITRVQVTAGPQFATPFFAEAPMMTLADLAWITHTAQRTPEDLWYFVRDLERPDRVSGFAWDLIDKWEVWREQKSFYRGGVPVSAMMFAPHAASAEWEDAAAAAGAERALHGLGLRELRAWPIRVLDHRGGLELADFRTDEVYQVLPWPIPVAVAKGDTTAPHEQWSVLWSVAVGIAWKLDHAKEAFLEAAARSGLDSLVLRFKFSPRRQRALLTLDSVDRTSVDITWDARLRDALAQDSYAVEAQCGELVASVVEPESQARFLDAWNAAPPGVRMDGYTVRQAVRQLPEPLELHDAVRSDILRQLGEHLADTSRRPATLEGAEATRFESHTVFPWLIAKLHEMVSDLSGPLLLRFALEQLERVHYQRFIVDKRLAWERGFPTGGGPADDERRESVARTTRVVSLIAEEVLAHPPNGQRPTDELIWKELLAVADLCIESCFRSDAIHHRLTRVAVEISDLYEVNIVDSNEPTDIDVRRYNQLRVSGTLPAAVPIAVGQDDESEADDEPRALVEMMPKLADIDAAMRSTLHFGLDALTGVLNVAAQWEEASTTSATLTSPEAVVANSVQTAVGATESGYAAALEWLTLRGADLAADKIPHWETERRAKRITTSPFVAVPEGLWLLPWTSESTMRILANYLDDGRLPWPNTRLPGSVVKALDRYRQARNRELEIDCLSALKARGLVAHGGVKPEKAKHYGIEKLSGEIDALCIDVTRSRMWVIEAKDPYTPYSARQIRRLIDDFNGQGKYVDRLLQKVHDISTCAPSVATKLEVDDPSRDWNVIGVLVTRHVEPAAFTLTPRVPFCTVQAVADVVDNDEVPNPGWAEPGLIGPAT